MLDVIGQGASVSCTHIIITDFFVHEFGFAKKRNGEESIDLMSLKYKN